MCMSVPTVYSIPHERTVGVIRPDLAVLANHVVRPVVAISPRQLVSSHSREPYILCSLFDSADSNTQTERERVLELLRGSASTPSGGPMKVSVFDPRTLSLV